MITLVTTIGAAFAQQYGFPTNLEDYGHFYPTAYSDHGGADWNCDTLTYTGHRGSDFGAGSFAGMDEGRTVTAAAQGIVVATNDGELDRCTTGDCPGGGGFGNFVQIQHADGKTTTYGHLKQWSVAVAAGDEVACGQVIGEMGSSGYSTGPHVHFEVRNAGGYAEDPFDGPCSAPPTYWATQGAYQSLPSLECQDPAPCAPVAALACGDTIAAANDDAGSTSSTWSYGCTDWTYSGPELSWTFSSELAEPVTLVLSGMTEDLDLYVLDSIECDGTGCVGSSSNTVGVDETVVFQATPGFEYTVVVDGWDGAVSDFTLTVGCEGAAPEPVETGDTAVEPVEPEPKDESPEPIGGKLVSGQPQGCACAAPGAPGSSGTGARPVAFAGSLGLLVSALARRRAGRATAPRALVQGDTTAR